YRMESGEDWIYPADGFSGRGVVGGMTVCCLSATTQVLCHAHGYEATEEDRQDMERLCESVAGELPPQLRGHETGREEPMNLDKVPLAAKLAQVHDHWRPRTVAQLNEYDIMVVKAQGEFVWHRHEETDDFFLVLDGRLEVRLRDRTVVLGP